jgi:hypothetical protein
MGLLAGQDTILESGERIANEVNAKMLLFGYIYCYFPVLSMLNGPLTFDAWTKNSCHIELDPKTFKILEDIGAIKPEIRSNVIYDQCYAETESHFDKSVSVPIRMYKCKGFILDEYDAWHDRCVDEGLSEEIEHVKNNLKEHMIDYYKDYKKYRVA